MPTSGACARAAAARTGEYVGFKSVPRGENPLNPATALVERIDRDELEQALRRAGAASGDGALAAVDVAPIGIGAMADTVKVRLRWSGEATGPDSLVAKLPSTDPLAG